MYVIVSTALVNHLNVRVFVLHNLIFNGAVVPIFAVIFNLSIYVWIFREDFTGQELL